MGNRFWCGGVSSIPSFYLTWSIARKTEGRSLRRCVSTSYDYAYFDKFITHPHNVHDCVRFRIEDSPSSMRSDTVAHSHLLSLIFPALFKANPVEIAKLTMKMRLSKLTNLLSVLISSACSKVKMGRSKVMHHLSCISQSREHSLDTFVLNALIRIS